MSDAMYHLGHMAGILDTVPIAGAISVCTLGIGMVLGFNIGRRTRTAAERVAEASAYTPDTAPASSCDDTREIKR